VRRSGDAILLIPFDNPWESLIGSLDLFSDDYMSDRCQPQPQVRDSFQ
jgi:antitoxin VapB